jgi:MFS transporter, DHA1 family, tetracycline resistance protein
MTSGTRKTALALVFTVVLIDLLGFGMVLPLLPVYAKQLMAGYSDDQTAWLLGGLMVSFSVMQFFFAPIWGRVSDRVGRRPILIMSLAGSCLFYFLFGIAAREMSLIGMFVARIGAGIAAATIPTAQAYIADVTPSEKRTSGMALVGAAFALGMTFGPLLGALALLQETDAGASPWPGFAAAGLSGCAFLLALFKLPESRTAETTADGPSFDRLASLRKAFTAPSIGLLLSTSFIYVLALAIFEVTLPMYVASYLGVERGGVQILLCFACIGVLKSLVTGVLVRRLAKFVRDTLLVSIGMGFTTLGYLLIAVLMDPDLSRIGMLIVATAIAVTGLSFLMPSVQSLISRRTTPEDQGVILGATSSVNSMARIVGFLVGMLLYFHGPAWPYWWATGLMGLAILLIVLAIRAGEDYSAVRPSPA